MTDFPIDVLLKIGVAVGAVAFAFLFQRLLGIQQRPAILLGASTFGLALGFAAGWVVGNPYWLGACGAALMFVWAKVELWKSDDGSNYDSSADADAPKK